MLEENNINKENNYIDPEKTLTEGFEVETLKSELEKVVKEKDEYLDGWKRAKAEFINYKKEESARLGEVIKFGSEDVIRDIVTVLDSFELGLASLEKAGPVEKGIYMIKGQLEDVLKRRGLEKVTVTPGEDFNPNYHESVGLMEVSLDKSYKSGSVAEEVETGYILNGKVLRVARVRLVK